MKFEKTLRACLMMYPGIFPNALTVYDHLFCVIGNGYRWENGELVDSNDKEDMLKDAVIKTLKFHLFESPMNSFDSIAELGVDFVKRRLKFNYETTIKEIEMIFDTDRRMQDFSFENADKYFGYANVEEKYTLYDLSEYSKICNLPDDIKKDWLEAAEIFYKFILEHRDRIEDKHNLLPKVGERIQELKNGNYERQEI